MAPPVDRDISHARKLAPVMDRYYLAPILGFVVPGVGDAIGSLIGFYLVAIAIKKGISPIVIARMVINILVDAVLGIVPLAGDLADLAWKSNTRNLALLEDRHARGKGTWVDWGLVLL